MTHREVEMTLEKAKEIIAFVEDGEGKIRLDNYVREVRYQYAKGYLLGRSDQRKRDAEIVDDVLYRDDTAENTDFDIGMNSAAVKIKQAILSEGGGK